MWYNEDINSDILNNNMKFIVQRDRVTFHKAFKSITRAGPSELRQITSALYEQ